LDLISTAFDPNEKVTGEDIILSARAVISVIPELIFAGNQEETILSARKSFDVMEDLFKLCKSNMITTDETQQKKLHDSTFEIAQAMCDLIEISKLNRLDNSTQPKLEEGSTNVSVCINNMVNILKRFPGCSQLKLEEDDIESVAERELNNCARLIAEAAAQLLEILPKKKKSGLDQDDINIAILEAAKAIARATQFLIEMASICQSERKESQKSLGSKYQNDPTWANGLISAAQQVAQAVQQLVRAANAVVRGEESEEALIVSARAVAAATAHLVAASRAKSDPDSKSQLKLAQAAKEVARATSELLGAAQAAREFQELNIEEEDLNSFGFAGGRVIQLEQQSKILSLEKEIEIERRSMLGKRKAKYSRTNN